MRIVTLLPSATEIVCALGREADLVGVSHSCDYPPGVGRIPAVTSTTIPYNDSSDEIDSCVRDHLTTSAALYELDIDRLRDAAPDVIVSQGLCDVCAVSSGDVISALNSLPSRPKIVDLEPNTLDEVFDDCIRVGEALGCTDAAVALVDGLRVRRHAVASLSEAINSDDRPRVVFLEWLVPPFSGGHWNPELVELSGGIDLLGAPARPSTSLDWNQIAASEPDVLFIACCGFTMERALQDIRQLEATAEWQKIPAVVNGNVFVTDGNAYFSRPGPRLLDGLEIMAHAFHPDTHPVSRFGSCKRISPSDQSSPTDKQAIADT